MSKKKQKKLDLSDLEKGAFTKQAKRAGFDSPLEFAKHVLANKENYRSKTIKRAQFVVNAAKWNKG